MLGDKSIGTLAVEDANLASEYAKCKEGKSTLVDLYDKVRKELIDFKAKVEGIIQ